MSHSLCTIFSPAGCSLHPARRRLLAITSTSRAVKLQSHFIALYTGRLLYRYRRGGLCGQYLGGKSSGKFDVGNVGLPPHKLLVDPTARAAERGAKILHNLHPLHNSLVLRANRAVLVIPTRVQTCTTVHPGQLMDAANGGQVKEQTPCLRCPVAGCAVQWRAAGGQSFRGCNSGALHVPLRSDSLRRQFRQPGLAPCLRGTG